jgi:hypothetical protein
VVEEFAARPPQKPSGMDKTTDRGVSGGRGAKSPEGEKSGRRRGSQWDGPTIGATIAVRAKVPAGSRHAGTEIPPLANLSGPHRPNANQGARKSATVTSVGF